MNGTEEKLELDKFSCHNESPKCAANWVLIEGFCNLVLKMVTVISTKTSSQPSAFEVRVWNMLLICAIALFNPKVQGWLCGLIGLKP
jgi:hypothetical protein